MADDPPSLIDRVRALQKGHTSRADEAEILALLRGAGDALAAVLAELDLAALLGDVDDHLTGPRHRAGLLDLLARERLAALPVALRARVVEALARRARDPAAEAALADVIVGTAGDALTALKELVDEGGDRHDLHRLVWSVLGAAARERVLAHVGAHGAEPRGLRVLSDVDDTFVCNWVDRRYPRGTVYPGVVALYEALASSGGAAPGPVVFLTARPAGPLGLVEERTLASLRSRGVARAVALTGDVLDMTSNARIAEGKYRNFTQYAALWPERRFVFLGDSGQGDALCGERMRREHGARVPAVFIHDVVATAPEVRERYAAAGVHFVDTWLGAAALAFDLGLVDAAALDRVARASVKDLAAVPFPSDAARGAVAVWLRRDLALAAERAPSLGDVTL